MQFMNKLSRRDAMRLAAMATVAGAAGIRPAFAAGAINFADIGVGDPGGDWSKYKAVSGYDVNLVSIGNAPSAILNVLVASGGQGTYDIINIVGGMQKPLVENDLVEKIDTSKMPNWSKDTYLEEFLGKGKPGGIGRHGGEDAGLGVGMLEEAELELEAEHAADGLVNRGK